MLIGWQCWQVVSTSKPEGWNRTAVSSCGVDITIWYVVVTWLFWVLLAFILYLNKKKLQSCKLEDTFDLVTEIHSTWKISPLVACHQNITPSGMSPKYHPGWHVTKISARVASPKYQLGWHVTKISPGVACHQNITSGGMSPNFAVLTLDKIIVASVLLLNESANIRQHCTSSGSTRHSRKQFWYPISGHVFLSAPLRNVTSQRCLCVWAGSWRTRTSRQKDSKGIERKCCF
jgi:hypothetical protein